MQCPQCNNEVPLSEANYGALFTCPQCMAVYFVSFEGQPEYGDMSITAQPDVEPLYELPPVSSTDEVVPSSFSVAASEITDYGNQQESVSQIYYDVYIKGLDTKEVLRSFKEAIEDSKFGWLPEDIISQIKNGESTLKNLNPIQAFVLAQRIQFLDLDIEWKQNVDF